MRQFLLIATITLFYAVSFANSVQIKLSDVVQRVSNENYNVYENALKVYQAKTNIEKARGDLLPRLNLWQIVGTIINPTSLFDNITDAAPFLVPNNWFRIEEVKLLYLAEREGYRALWGNELNTAKAMYAHLLLDQGLYKHVQRSVAELEKIHRIIKTRETFGGAPPGTAREVEIKLLGLKEDEKNLQVLLAQENYELSYVLGYDSDSSLDLEPLKMPDFENLKPINPKEYEFRLLSTAPERRQFDHFLSVISQIKKEIQYSFLGVSEISRGAAGGIFDGLPIPNGLGGKDAAMKMADAQKEIVKVQKRGVEETLKRQLNNTAGIFNSDISHYDNFKLRAELSKQSKDALLRRIQLGEKVDVLQLSESSRNQIQAESALLAIQYRFVTSLDRMERLTFTGDYEKTAPLIESLKGVKP
jgi:outer membrane protein TolC